MRERNTRQRYSPWLSLLLRVWGRVSLLMALWMTLWMGMASTSNATVLQDLDFPALVAQSRLIFVGSVQSQREELQGELVTTYVTFQIETVFKGSVSTHTVELPFTGGQSGGVTTHISGQFIPPVGKRSVFFVANPDAKQINALSGWQQGYFPLVQGPDGADYLDMRQRPDLKIPGLIVDPLVAKMQGMGFSVDAIAGKVPRAYLFSLADFRDAIADELRQQGIAP